jgi:hypothetical protein
VVASLEEVASKTKQIAAEFQKLEAWEKQGKINVDGEFDKLGFKGLDVIDDSIGPEIRRMQVVTYQEIDLFYVQTDRYPELFDASCNFKGEDE